MCAETMLDLSTLGGLEIAVRGDGKTYTMVLSCGHGGYSSIEYVATIPPRATAHKWRTVRLPWGAFTPQHKTGKSVEAPPFDGVINSMGFAIGDRQWGPFLLEVAYIKALY